eukprot:302648_1
MSTQTRYNLRPRKPKGIPDYYTVENMITDIPECCQCHEECVEPKFKDRPIRYTEFVNTVKRNSAKSKPTKPSNATSNSRTPKQNKKEKKEKTKHMKKRKFRDLNNGTADTTSQSPPKIRRCNESLSDKLKSLSLTPFVAHQ